MQALLTTLILIYLTLMILFKLISSFKSSKIFTLILLVCRYIELRSFRPTNKQCIKLQRLSCYCIFFISFNNVCRYLLTVLSKQKLIQPLGYLTSSELLRSKAKSFFYVIDASRPNIWGKKSVVMSVYNSEKYYTTHIVFRNKNS